jgi:addiction module HigA family antidote
MIDFSEVSAGKRLPLVHPGEILRDEFLQPMKISVYTLAQAIKVPRSRVNDIVLGRRGITADTALRLSAPRRISGSTFRFVTIWTRPIESFAGGSSVRSGREQPDGSRRSPDGAQRNPGYGRYDYSRYGPCTRKTHPSRRAAVCPQALRFIVLRAARGPL